MQAAFESKEAYYRAIGYQEEDGKLESTDSYVGRLTQHMKLYGALIQVFKRFFIFIFYHTCF